MNQLDEICGTEKEMKMNKNKSWNVISVNYFHIATLDTRGNGRQHDL